MKFMVLVFVIFCSKDSGEPPAALSSQLLDGTAVYIATIFAPKQEVGGSELSMVCVVVMSETTWDLDKV